MKNYLVKFGILIGTFIIIMNNVTFAQTPPEGRTVNVDRVLYKFMVEPGNPTPIDYVQSLPEANTTMEGIGNIVYFMLILANVLTFVSFIVAAVYLLISQGDDQDIQDAKRMFKYTVLAMIIAAMSLAVVTGITKVKLFG